MAETDPNTPQVVDPELTVDLTRLLQIRGPLGVLNVLDTIVPVVNMGDVVTRTVTVLQPSFRSSDVFSNGILNGPAANTILADTGALAEGVYDLIMSFQTFDVPNALSAFVVEHRNAANAANLAVWNYLTLSDNTVNRVAYPNQMFAYEFSLNERLRISNNVGVPIGFGMTAVIFARRRV